MSSRTDERVGDEIEVEVGTVVVDGELGTSDHNPAIVVQHADEPASEHHIEDIGETVAEVNPTYPEDDPVAIIAFADALAAGIEEFWNYGPQLLARVVEQSSVTTYSYPQSRLTRLVEASEEPPGVCRRCGGKDLENHVEARDTDHRIVVGVCSRCEWSQMVYDLSEDGEESAGSDSEEPGWSA